MKFDKQKDIHKYVSRELGLDADLIDSVISEYWKTIRNYITNPLECKEGIMLNTFGNIYIDHYKLKGFIERNNIKSEFYNKLLKQTKK